jgi:serine/threonine protein kinase
MLQHHLQHHYRVRNVAVVPNQFSISCRIVLVLQIRMFDAPATFMRKITRFQQHYYACISVRFLQQCLRVDASDRPTCSQLIKHEFFQKDDFAQRFAHELKIKHQREQENNVLRRTSNKNDDNKEKENGAKKKKIVKKVE